MLAVPNAMTLLDQLIGHAERTPETPALEAYDGALRQSRCMTYGELVRAVGARAEALRSRLGPGDCAIIALPFGPDYVVSLLAVLLLGGVAIPGMPATRRSAERLAAMFRAGKPKLILHDGLNAYAGVEMVAQQDALLAISDLDEDLSTFTWRAGRSRDVALLQFTSGSTSSPKAVILTHENITANQLAIARQFGHGAQTRLLGWLPLFHDMGLIGNTLQPLFLGGTAIMVAPTDIIARPLSWLRLIEATNAHTSGGPNFIYDLCVQRISDEEVAGLDLSGWITAYNGSELVRPHTLARFVRKFAPAGFQSAALLPCYGMAEASLLVCGQRYDVRADKSPQTPCGPCDAETRVIVVDPERLAKLPDGELGEILISGPGVAQGYLTAGGVDTSPFDLAIEGEEDARFFRTGDRGYIRANTLFVTGRSKDIIKIRGETYHPEDLESVVERECALVDVHGVCALGVQTNEAEEAVVVLVEVARSLVEADQNRIYRDVRKALATFCGVAVAKVVLVQRGTLSRTSSGKFLRWRCAERLRDRQIPIVRTMAADPGRLEPS